jgi:hypothetical protein
LILTCNLVNNFGVSNPVDLFYSLPLKILYTFFSMLLLKIL